MIRRRQEQRTQRAGQVARRGRRSALAAHRLFAPILTTWGALLGGLVVQVLPAQTVLMAAARLGLGGLGLEARVVLIALAAAVLGSAMFALAQVLSRRGRAGREIPSVAAAVRRMRPINPASELGSASLDAPIETVPFAGRKRELSAAALSESVTESEPEPEPEPEAHEAAPPEDETAPPEDETAPLALDLAEFAALPGRNAVWVEEPHDAEPEASPPPEDAAPVEAPPTRSALRPRSESAIERLRAIPTSELSLIQMVERFAAALHEHQALAAGSPVGADAAGREAELAEALRALAAFAPAGDDGDAGQSLRDAIAGLEGLRGAA